MSTLTTPSQHIGTVMGTPRRLLQAEGLAIFIAAAVFYGILGKSWWLFAGLLLVPDLFMLGYLRNNRTGAALYNMGHTTVLPLFLLCLGFWNDNSTAISVALIWIAHIGMDRAIGYGLKYEHGFNATHLGGAT